MRKKKFTMLLVSLLVVAGVVKAQDQVMGLKKLPETSVDLAQGLVTGYYLLKQVNDHNDCAGGNGVGWIKASSEAASVSATSVGTGTPGEDGALYIWYVEVIDATNRLIKISTANKVASWYLPENSQREKKLIAYANATTLQYHNETCVDLGQGANEPKDGSAFISNNPVTSYIHFSGNNLGSWTSSGINSTYMVEFYAIPTEDLIVYAPTAVAKLELESYIAEASAGLGSIALQTSNANAAGYLSSCGSADGNVESNMIDGSNSTFFGSPWMASVAGIDYQYWQVDLGEGVSLSEFVFSYVTRANGDDTPYSIVVKGSADGKTFNELTTIAEGLPQTASASYTSSNISNPSNYRYIRFDVTDARKGSGASPGHAAGGHATQKTFAIAEFALINKDEASWSEQDKAIKAAIDAAQEVLDADDATVETIAEALHNVKVAEAVKPEYPFTITTDDANPSLYAIKSGRTDNSKEWWYTYNATDGKISLTQYTAAQTQYWYFKEVLTADYKYALQLYPYLGEGAAMSYENTQNNSDKIVAKALDTQGWNNLWLLATTNGKAPYGLQTYDMVTYLSNFGGVSNNMGMWSAAPASDEGTAMYFVNPAEALQTLIDKAEDLSSNEGNAVGCYTDASLTNLREAIEQAKEDLSNKNYSVDALNTAIDALVMILPTEGAYYNIVSSCTDDSRAGQSVYVNADGRMQFAAAGETASDFARVFQFVPASDGKFYIYNVENNTYMNTVGYTLATAIDNAKSVTITNMGKDNIVKIVPEGQSMMHAQANGSVIVGWDNDSYTNGSAWTIVETEAPNLAEVVKHTLTVTTAGWSTLVLPHNTTIPANVEVFVASEIKDDKVMLSAVENVLPAHTPVLVKAVADNYVFNYTAETATVENNLLEGSVFNLNVSEDGYVLATTDENGVGLYKAKFNVVDLDKNVDADGDGNATNDYTAFLNNAKKAYLPASVVPDASAPMFSFDRGEGTTGIESSELNIQPTVIYDLLGRRVEKMEKGIYIVNGKKIVK